MHQRFHVIVLATALAMSCGLATIARAQATADTPGLNAVDSGHAKVRLTVTAGPNGAPGGFGLWWMTADDFAANGYVWPQQQAGGESWAAFTGTATLNTWGEATLPFPLAPNESIDIEVGDLFDETGVVGVKGELDSGIDYEFCAYAFGGSGIANSPFSVTCHRGTTPQGGGCTYTLGYWKNHTAAWPSSSVTLGTVSYTQAQILTILSRPVQGNGLVSLAHQLIATKLNILNGADATSIAAAVASADGLIGGLVIPPIGSGSLAPSATNQWTQKLDDYNNGELGPGHCGAVPAHTVSWGRMKAIYR